MEFKYLGCVLDESGTNGAEYNRKEASGRRVAGAIRSLVNVFEFARVLHETLLVSLLMYGNETMLCREKERSRVRAVQMDNLRGLLGIRRMDRVMNARITELCRARKGLDERIDEGILRWFRHVEKMNMDRITKRVYVGECSGSHSVGRPWKRWIDTVKECLRKRGLDVRQARRMFQDRSEWRGFVRENAWGIVQGITAEEMD